MRRTKRVTVSDSAIKDMIARNTTASARHEGRELPDGHTRSQAVQDYLDGLASRSKRDAAQNISYTDSDSASVGYWNYRVVQSADGSEYFIAEVYYAGDKLGWVDGSRDLLRWERYQDLIDTVQLIRHAFDQPLLRVTEDDRLVEATST
ncbi:hypothetical protein M4D79_28380 [Mycolicibacterium novocastrense]|nr:hypothetical protein M4D79_28380 [Mycolicibacterium novocastrense]